MPLNFSRRIFLSLTGGALFAPYILFGKNEAPTLLDHILLGSADLQAGIDFVESRTGVRATFGGVHPGRGTQNALLSLGQRKYLEIIAPDPAQPETKNPLAPHLHTLSEPALVGWAAHPGELNAFAKKLRYAGIVFDGPTPGSRKRPDGRLLQWKTLNLADDASGLLPFFIEWSADSPHPAAAAPSGLRLLRFELATPQPDVLVKTIALASLDTPIVKAGRPHLHASFAGPKGNLELTS